MVALLDEPEPVPDLGDAAVYEDGLLYVRGQGRAFYVLVDAPKGSPAKPWATVIARRVLERFARGEARLMRGCRSSPTGCSSGSRGRGGLVLAAPPEPSGALSVSSPRAAGCSPPRWAGRASPSSTRPWSTSPCPTSARTSTPGWAALQWVLTGYLLAVSSLILLGGSLGDRFGRKRVFQTGVVVFALASLVCAVAPTVQLLVAGRVLQGVGGALLTPGSLAILEASFRPGRAGPGHRGLVGPVRRGFGHRAVPRRVAGGRGLVALDLPHQPAPGGLRGAGGGPPRPRVARPEAARHVDVVGAVLVAAGLGGLSWGLIVAGDDGWSSPTVWGPLLFGAAALVLFVVDERRSRDPMVPPEIFASAQFRAANLVTAAVYAALGGTFFLLVVQLQTVARLLRHPGGGGHAADHADDAGAVGPVRRAGRPHRPPAADDGRARCWWRWALWGWSASARATPTWARVLPAVLVMGAGLATVVAPLTATALSAVEDRHAGVASGVNTTVARAAQLAAVAALPVAAGITGEALPRPGGVLRRLPHRHVHHRRAWPPWAASSPRWGSAIRERVPEVEPAPAPTGFFCGAEGPPLHTCPGSTAGRPPSEQAA